MKKSIAVFLIVLAVFLCSCKEEKAQNTSASEASGITLTDAFGNSAVIPENPEVVSAYGSFAECWLLAGGELAGVTEDAISERRLELSPDTAIIGTVKDVNLEKIVSLDPDYLILSADIANQVSLKQNLEALGIPHGYFRVDSFKDYAEMMKQFCSVTGRNDLYTKNVTEKAENIQKIKAAVPEGEKADYLLMRVYSTGIKVKTDNIADIILKELGAQSIADRHPSLLTDLSIEEVLHSSPDYIFVLTMGDENAAAAYFENNIINNPAWSGLDAVKNGNYRVLPKELFHYKPNNRWEDSYKYLAEILYPEIFNEE